MASFASVFELGPSRLDLVRLVWSYGPEGMIRFEIETNTDHALSRRYYTAFFAARHHC